LSSIPWLLLALGPALLAWGLIAMLRASPLATRFADQPNERSLHEVATPRIGGIGVMVAGLVFAFAWASPGIAVALGAALFLAIISLVDDLRALPISVRLPAHLAAAAVAILAIASPDAGHPGLTVVECGLALLAIAWMTNLFNFMDGSDGLAGGMAVIGFAALAVAGFEARNFSLAVTCTCLASAAAGFLPHNFPPARVFLGDAGSIPLGFLAATLGLVGFVRGAWPAWFPLAVFAPFIADATLTLARRVARGEPFWRAHRSHAYQRLVLAGWTRRGLALAAYALMLASVFAAFAALRSDEASRSGIIMALLAVYVLLFAAIEMRVRIR